MIVNGTDILYMDDIDGNYIKEFGAICKEIKEDEKGRGYLVLDRTAFYPAGAGQESDTGNLGFTDPISGETLSLVISRVAKKDDIRHYVEEGDAIHIGKLTPGQEVTCSLDWKKRYQHMRMHTAQHLVSAVVYNITGALTVGNQIHAKRSRIDFSPLSHDKVDTKDIENQCSDFIRMNPRIRVFFEKRSIIEGTVDAERCNVSLIPQSVRELRIVKIEEVELCPCAGTHIRDLAELNGINIESVRSKGKEKVRITYELL